MVKFWTPSPSEIFCIANFEAMLTTIGIIYHDTDPKLTFKQIHYGSFHQRLHRHAVLSSKLLILASVPSSTTQSCCDFLSLQFWLCTLLLRISSSSCFIRRVFWKIVWPCDYIFVPNQSFVQTFSLHEGNESGTPCRKIFWFNRKMQPFWAITVNCNVS